MGFCLHSLQVMALRSRCSSPSSSRVRLRTQVASNEKTPSPDIGRVLLPPGLTREWFSEWGKSVNESGVECWSGSTSVYPGGGELRVEWPILAPLAADSPDVM